VFTVLSTICAALVWREWSSSKAKMTADFSKFQKQYVGVWLAMMAADWLQGPYVYALYASYGFSKKEIGELFIMGFGASMVLGTIVGSLADKYGRKNCCVAFCVFYALSCVTKHSSDYWILMIGRLLGGVATSLLFSVFEAWMISTHFSNGFDGDQLGDTFTKAYFGNSIVAICAGVVGGFAADSFGLVAPFDMSMCLLICGGVIISMNWGENYGDSEAETLSGFTTAFEHLRTSRKIWLVGTAQSLFEGAMYTFVFMWTPQLEETTYGKSVEAKGEKLPYGTIFAIFMVSCMIGSTCVNILSRWKKPGEYMIYVFALGAFSLTPSVAGMEFEMQLLGFCLFEFCVGIYFPTWGSLRSSVIPEESRSAIMNLFRVPLNLWVVLILINIENIKGSTVFGLCFGGMLAAAFCQHTLNSLSHGEAKASDAMKEAAAELEGLASDPNDEDIEAGEKL